LRVNDGNLWIKCAKGWEPLFSASMLIAVQEFAKLRNLSAAGFLWEVVDAELAQCRRLKLDEAQVVPEGEPIPPGRPRKPSAAAEGKRRDRNKQIIELRKQGLKPPAIAERVHCSAMTVGRVLRRNETEQSA
jgi:hypothetical protein